MSERSRAERNRWYAAQLASALHGEGPLPSPVGEEGDLFRVELDDGPATVRVDELARPGDDEGRVREPVRAYRRAVARAAREHWSAGPESPNVEVWISFGQYEQSTAGRDREEIGGRVCELVREHLPGEGEMDTVLPSRRDDVPFPLGLASVTVARLPTYTRAYWWVGGAAPVPEHDSESLQDAVGEPPDDVVGRRLRLLVAGGSGVLSAELAEDADRELDPAGFDGVYLLEPGSGRVRSLAGG